MKLKGKFGENEPTSERLSLCFPLQFMQLTCTAEWLMNRSFGFVVLTDVNVGGEYEAIC